MNVNKYLYICLKNENYLNLIKLKEFNYIILY